MPFQPIDVINRWDGGANTRQLNDVLQKNESSYPLNVQFEGKKISKAPGYTVFGTEADDTLVGYNLYNHRVLSEEEVLIKVIGGRVKYYDEITGVWQLASSTTYTTAKKWWFASFNGYLYGGNDTDSMQRWQFSSWSTLNGATAIGTTTIDLATDTGARFATTGSGLIEGDAFTWTGRTADQLTGVTGLTASHVEGSRVTVEPVAYASVEKSKIGLFYRNRNYIVSASSSNFLYFSRLADNTNPQDDLANFTITGSGSGDAGFIITDAPILDATIYINGSNQPVLVIFCANGVTYAVTVTDEAGTTVGAAVPFKVFKEDIAGVQQSAVTENDLLFIGKSGTIRAMGYGESSSTLKSSRLTDEIQSTVESIDFSDGNMIYFDRRIFITGKANNADQNNFILVKDTNPSGFLFWDYISANVFCEWKDNLYFLSSVNGNVYKMFSGRSAGGNEIASSYITFANDFNAPLILKLLGRVRFQGQLSEGCDLTVKILFDDEEVESFVISGSDTNIIAASTGVAIGTVTFGTGAFRSNDEGAPIRRSFTAEWNMRNYKYFYKISVEFFNNASDVDFLLDKHILFAEIANPDLTYTKHIL